MTKAEKEICVLMRMSKIEVEMQLNDCVAVVGKCKLTGKHVVRAIKNNREIIELVNKAWVPLNCGVTKDHRRTA